MKIISRREERRELEYCEKSKKSELICVYGRRRVGKTFLIEQTFKDFAFRAVGLEKGSTKQKLAAFEQRLKEYGDDSKSTPKNWFEAFSRLDKILSKDTVRRSTNGKRIVFFDEFPWFASKRSDFLLAFEEFWNRRGTQDGDLMFILCGSATSWIIKEIIKNTGNMYKRVTKRIYIKPFTLSETELFFKDREFDWQREQIAECQMIFGGLPFFFDIMNPSQSLAQNMDRLLFSKDALYKGETQKLLEATLSSSPIYGKILRTIAFSKYGIKKSKVKEMLGIPDGTYFRAIEDLVDCGYIIEYKKEYEDYNPLYIQLADPFLLFHYYYIEKQNKNSYDDVVTDVGYYSNWRGQAFEMLCLQNESCIKGALGIGSVETDIYPWYNSEDEKDERAQIDIVIERADKITNLCELKYSNTPFEIDAAYEQDLIRKREIYREKTGTKQALKIIMISAKGLKGTAHTSYVSEVITLDDLFDQ
ncbi:AAA family ATPase [Butyrivibrio sp. WCD2001]|uniref:AAA family ATPase n=1 Tax=Butyrivibrio sp. WCD2001 TaxID=1280681 RepID=UPI0004276DFD|nr:ATP-binding protein [Butyrivibrio sp. WCD2001]